MNMRYQIYKQLSLVVLIVGLMSCATAQHKHHVETNHRAHHASELESHGAVPGASVYQLDAKWQNQMGESIPLKHFQGQNVVIAMIYLSCEHVCPVIVEHVKMIEEGLHSEARKSTRFVLVTFDPENDSLDMMRHYQQKRDLGDQWTLLRGGDADVRALAAILGVKYKKLSDGSYAHSNTITHLDQQGVIRTQRLKLDDPMDPIMHSLQGH